MFTNTITRDYIPGITLKTADMIKIKVFLVDDHRLLTDTWTILLNQDPRFSVVGSSADSQESIKLIEALRPDIALVDIAMSPLDGFELTRQLVKLVPHPRIIGVSLYKMPAYAKKIMYAGAMGYVTKNSSKEELIEAMLQVHSGGKYMCQEIKDYMSQDVIDTSDVESALVTLTRKQMDIINHIKEGLTSKEIAVKEGITTKTVEVHRYNILKKLGVHNSAELINVMTMRGL